MSVSLSGRWSGQDDDRAFAGQSGPVRILGTIRAIATPSNLMLAGAVAFGWLALVAWTGNGPDGWQARSCAEFDLGRASCSTIRFTKDQSRIAPFMDAADAAR
ncbi:hypothetical protein [Methylobacterium haplocladii]|uniref:Uncharacterized protein n=1 Tax=Methylobacterium haplocladii TaxID=1176176 RepID=A0A512IRK0_9HYPH|nr:hypothetical protein [Methylobacterium haplocladii]GEP00337.1 hypothetical protein MHA02_27240 [Methylobacterium haplocladii]GLS61190.1 hypothetical protein GCM10007887_38870 [Methylobacterium haplocladii]